MSDAEPTADGPAKGRVVKSSLGVLGALATIISVWWFALRPRRRAGREGDTTE